MSALDRGDCCNLNFFPVLPPSSGAFYSVFFYKEVFLFPLIRVREDMGVVQAGEVLQHCLSWDRI